MMISQASAQDAPLQHQEPSVPEPTQITGTEVGVASPNVNVIQPPSTGELIFQNVMMVAIMVTLFFVLFILPQRRRAKEHAQMLSALKKGDKVITGGGLIGTVDKLVNDDEIIIELADGIKVTAVRSTVYMPAPKAKPSKAANDTAKG
jgi:preprotein translocase subunit YajC